jgi:hypothetical protein
MKIEQMTTDRGDGAGQSQRESTGAGDAIPWVFRDRREMGERGMAWLV